MATIRLQGEIEKKLNIYYEFDPTSKPLGEGGMGKVYAGRRVNIKTHEMREVAIKFMFKDLPASAIEKARREASIIIPNENLLEMMGFLALEYSEPSGAKYIRYHVISELLTGVTLADLIQGKTTDADGNNIPYAQTLYNKYNQAPEEFAVIVIKKLLSGIMALHDNGYIHRDIDPSNIMITNDGKIKLIDFGISKRVDGLVTNDKYLTTAGQFVGKPQYAAPELVLGDIHSQNKWTDIYAIGILMFQLITGHLPFNGPANVILSSHLRKKMPLGEIKNKKLRAIIAKATDKDITRRYQSAAEMRVAIDAEGNGGSSKLIYVSALAAVCVAVVIGLVVWLWPEPKTDVPVEQIDNTEITEQKTDESAKDDITTLKKDLQNPSTAKEAFSKLQAKAGSGDSDALFILSRIYAVSIGSFAVDNEYATMQENLKDEVTQDALKAHSLLGQIIANDANYYQALYELACNYYQGPEMTGGEARNLRQAKNLLDKAYELADKADDVGYKNKISALLRKY